MGTLHGMYFEEMIGSSSTNFENIVTIGERIENGVKSGKIVGIVAQQTVNKKPHGGFTKNKEGETSVLTASVHPQYQFPMVPMSYYSYTYVIDAQYQQPPCSINHKIAINN